MLLAYNRPSGWYGHLCSPWLLLRVSQPRQQVIRAYRLGTFIQGEIFSHHYYLNLQLAVALPPWRHGLRTFYRR